MQTLLPKTWVRQQHIYIYMCFCHHATMMGLGVHPAMDLVEMATPHNKLEKKNRSRNRMLKLCWPCMVATARTCTAQVGTISCASAVDPCMKAIMSACKHRLNTTLSQCISVCTHTQPNNRKPSFCLHHFCSPLQRDMAGKRFEMQLTISLTLAEKIIPSPTRWTYHT